MPPSPPLPPALRLRGPDDRHVELRGERIAAVDGDTVLEVAEPVPFDAPLRGALTGLSGVFRSLSCEGLGAGIEDDDEGALMGFAGSMRANCCPSQLGFAGAWVTPSGISTQGSFSAHQICRLGATQLGSSSVPALMNAIAPYAGPWL